MSSKDTMEKVKQFFRFNSKSGSATLRNRDFVLTPEIEKEICSETPTHRRIKTIKELSEIVLANRLEEKAIVKLWYCMQDLLSDKNRDTRHVSFNFICCLVRGQPERLGLLRVHFFRLVKEHTIPDDTLPRFELLQNLIENGKYIIYFEEEIAPFLIEWMPDITAIGKTLEFLNVLVNLIKYHASYVDQDVITATVANTCLLCCNSGNQQATVLACLQVLDTIVCYSILPNESLPTFIAALCRTVNHEIYCQNSWKIMRNLLGTHLGHSALFTMCRVLQEPTLASDAGLLRGAVFHINMGLWGRHRVQSLHCTPAAVLPSFIQAIKSNHPVVLYEIMLSVQRLVNKYGSELQDPTWDIILDVIESIIEHIESNPSSTLVVSHLHDTLFNIEQLMELGQYNGSIKRTFEVIERCAPARSEESVLRLVIYLATSIVPTRHLWLSKLNSLLERYYKQESRTNVRKKVLDILNNVIKVNRSVYEDELMDRIVLVHLQNVASDPDIIIRNATADLIIQLSLECDSKRCLELLDILEKLLKRPFEACSDGSPLTNEMDILDVKTVIDGLVRLFMVKIHSQPVHAVRIYKMLVSHLEIHYNRPHVFENINHIRYKVFESFMKIRANNLYHIGYPDGVGSSASAIRFSPYLTLAGSCIICGVSGGGTATPGSPPPNSPAAAFTNILSLSTQLPHAPCILTHVSLKRGFKAVVTCLKQEKDWEVLRMVLQEIPKVMENKSLILSRQGNNDVELLATALCNMITEKSCGFPETLYNVTIKMTRSDFHSHILPVLASLASYHAYLESSLQKKLVRCLTKSGLVSRYSRTCIVALTTCALEMREIMIKLLPEVLLDLSKLSATVNIAIPILEFLSVLTCLPNIFASFVGDQYMSVFAMCMPYTNPLKYNHYTVSLAHHVIAMWFLKCRLPFRRDFVKFITTGLKTNARVPFEEGQFYKPDLAMLNEDSSNRKRSSSLTEQGSRGGRRGERLPGRLDVRDLRPPIDEALNMFHTELTETCVDLMARYTFSPCSVLPKRLPTAEFLLAGGQSMTWLVGNKLITVTTSGCSQKALKNGLCDKCLSVCKSESFVTPDSDSKRYSKSNLMHSTSGEDSQSNRVTRQNSSEVQKSSQDSPVEEKKDVVPSSNGAAAPSEKLEQLPNKLHQLLHAGKYESRNERVLCACWCQGWAEVYVRRPTGDMSWVMRIQNQISQSNTTQDIPFNELSTLYLPSLDRKRSETDTKTDESDADSTLDRSGSFKSSAVSSAINIPGSPLNQMSSCQDSHESINDDLENDYYEDNGKSRNPVRRSNSSPEMSASWKNPFMNQDKTKGYDYCNDDAPTEVSQKKPKNYGKDMRVSCEAIPEEIIGLGTTPPESVLPTDFTHPTLLSCHSYPGTVVPPGSTAEVIKPSATVPASPISIENTPYQADVFKSIKQPEIIEKDKIHERPKNLPVFNKQDLQPLTVKPPQSPTQTSPRFSKDKVMDKQMKFRQSVEGINSDRTSDTLLMPLRRDRGHTISVMSPARKPKIRRGNSPRGKETPKSGINPSFVFLQLYHSANFGNDKPLLVSQSQMIQRGLQLLDHIPPYETHKIGVVYVGPGQCNNQVAILRNAYGSLRYVKFLQELGTLIKLQDVDYQRHFLGGLDENGKDGKFAYIWQDDIVQMVFHVATLMPSEDNDPSCNEKKKHIGNDFVCIVYNESGEEYNLQTMTGFNFACVVIEPLDHSTNRITMKARDEIAEHIGHSEPKIISDENVSLLARQLALHANLASLISCSLKSASGHNPYASNWLERLRHIKRLRSKVLQEISELKEKGSNGNMSVEIDILSKRSSQTTLHMDDFTEYT